MHWVTLNKPVARKSTSFHGEVAAVNLALKSLLQAHFTLNESAGLIYFRTTALDI